MVKAKLKHHLSDALHYVEEILKTIIFKESRG